MTVTGHRTRSVFDRYDIVNEEDLRTALGKLAMSGTRQEPKARVARFRRKSA